MLLRPRFGHARPVDEMDDFLSDTFRKSSIKRQA